MGLTELKFFHLKFWGDGSDLAKSWVDHIIVRDTSNRMNVDVGLDTAHKG